MKKKNWIGAISVIMSALLLMNCFGIFSAPESQKKSEKLTRTIPLDETKLTNLDSFVTYSISDEDDVPVFSGSSVFCEEDASFFNNVALEDDPDEYSTSFFCTFDMEELVYHIEISLIDKNGQVTDTENIDTPAFVNENGMLDALVEIGDEAFLLSDATQGIVDNCFFTWLAAISPVVIAVTSIYHAVTETAEQIRCRQNYNYNKQLESSGEGVFLGNYIYKQNEERAGSDYDGYRSNNYHFGFTTFGGVGCEAASAYNALIAMGKPEMLSETIYSFEKLAIEHAFAWGNFGSSAMFMTIFFDARDISYQRFFTFSNLKKAADKYESCNIIISEWLHPVTNGIHTYFIKKSPEWEEVYHGYNFNYKKPGETEKNNNLKTFYDGDKFNVGYILTRK